MLSVKATITEIDAKRNTAARLAWSTVIVTVAWRRVFRNLLRTENKFRTELLLRTFNDMPGMDGKHLSKGSESPPFTKGQVRLYNMRFCPFAHRAHLVLEAKKIPYEVVNIHLSEKPEWYFEKNPEGKVPAIELESGDCIYESLIVADYLDEKYPTNPLHSKDPLQKAKDKILLEKFGKVSGLVFRFFREVNKDNFDTLLNEVEVFEKELASRGTLFFSGTKPGMVDYMIWPWFERIDGFLTVAGDNYKISKTRFPKIDQWRKAMVEDEVVKVVYITPEYHTKFIHSFVNGPTNYDLLVK